jgi:uncharacterized OB-fold protein
MAAVQTDSAAGTDPLDLSGDEPRLVGGLCSHCRETMFPRRDHCPRCAGDEVERLLLPSRGILWTWTIQGFAPKSPPYLPDGEDGEFAPFGVGYVELPGYLRIETRLTESSPERLRIGMEVSLVAVERAGRWSYAFAPVVGETGSE